LHTSRAMKNNRHVFFYIGGNSVLRVETILWIFGGVFKILIISIEQFELWSLYRGFRCRWI